MLNQLITDAEIYCAARGIKLATLGAYAVGDRTLFARLGRGGECLPSTVDRVRRYMAENPTAQTPTPNEDAA